MSFANAIANSIVTGSQSEFFERDYAELPLGWFPDPDEAPVVNAVVTSIANAAATSWSQLQDVRAQSRISTATGIFLDLCAQDYFGAGAFPRRPSEGYTPDGDNRYRARIKKELLRPRGTRDALYNVLLDLTGTAPDIFEPQNVRDTGGWGVIHQQNGVQLGYGTSGRYGSMSIPFTVFCVSTRPYGEGIANVDGYSGYLGGYGVGAIEYASASDIAGDVTDAEIERAVNVTLPAGVACALSIRSGQ